MLSTDNDFYQSHHDVLRDVIYTPIEQAIELLELRRQMDIDLEDFDIPDALKYPRTAVLFRQIATPNHEMRRVIELCDKFDLNLVVLAFQQDKFSSHNDCKHALGRMGFFAGFGRHGGRKIRYCNIIDFNQCDGLALCRCKTYRQQSLVDFHHNLLLSEFPQLSRRNIVDNSEWFIRHHTKYGNLYHSYLKLFLKHAILFETFVLSGRELDFTLTRVLPAFQEIVNEFGIKPLIVHSEAPDREGDEYWQLYPDHLREFAPYDRRRMPRYEAPFTAFDPMKVGHFNKTKPLNKTIRL